MPEQYQPTNINSPLAVRAISGPGTFELNADDGLTIIAAGAPTLTLPDVDTVPGREVFIKSVVGTGTVDTTGGQLIDTDLTFTFTVAQQILFLKAGDGVWRVVDNGTSGFDETWAATLIAGNTSGGTDVQISNADDLLLGDGLAGALPQQTFNAVVGVGTSQVSYEIAGVIMWEFLVDGATGVWAWRRFAGGVFVDNALLVDPSIGDISMSQRLFIGGAVAADGPAGALDIIIGDGTDASGITIFTGAADEGAIVFTDAAGVATGKLAYDHGLPGFDFMVETANEMSLTATALFPEADAGLDLGIVATNRWQDAHLSRAVLIAGAVQADADAGADDLVIGDGTAADFGMTFNVLAGNFGEIAWNDGTNDRDGGIRYDGAAYTIRINNNDRVVLNLTELRPVGTNINIGATAAGSRWGTAFINGPIFVAGADAGDAPAGALDIVIGDGSDAAGLTIFTSATTEGTIVFTDGIGVEQASIAYDHNVPQFEWTVETSLEMLLTTVALSPGADDGNSLGTDALRWLDVFQGRSIYGVAATGATITVTTTGRIMADAAIANVDVDLPDALEGLDYQIIVLDATNGVDVTPTGSDSINGGVAGTAVTLSVAGRYFITAEDATDWWLHGPLAEV